MTIEKKKVIFIGTNNSVWLQMAETILNYFYGERHDTFSAGSTPTEVNPITTLVLKDIGIDVSRHYSKGLDLYRFI